MNDEVVLRQEPKEVHPEGQFGMLCVDLISLGMRVQEFEGNQSAVEACAFIFTTGATTSKGYPLLLAQELNVTTGQRSKLVKFLSDWRGKPFTPEELGSGFSLSSFVGKTALGSIIRKVSRLGNPRAEIGGIMPLPKGMAAPLRGDYKRAEFWAKKKAEYAAAYQAFMSKTMKGEPDEEPTPKDEVPF